MSKLVEGTELNQEETLSPDECERYMNYIDSLYHQEERDSEKAVKVLRKHAINPQEDLEGKTSEEGPKLVLK